jgi:hypothetical protein
VNKGWVPILGENDRVLLPFAKLPPRCGILGSVGVADRHHHKRACKQALRDNSIELLRSRAAPVSCITAAARFKDCSFED